MSHPKGSLGLSIGLIVAVALLILSASIAVPIWFRPFFYWHIDWLHLTDTGWTRAEIKEAYNEMINYCTLYMPMRKTDGQWYYGVMKCSESGRDHFTDVRKLFTLDAVVMLVSLVYVVTVGVLSKKNVIKIRRLAKRSPAFWGGLAAIVVPVVVASLAAIDFDRAFEVFHAIFFPGKDNWIFDYRTDEIINVMPEEFFRDCAILIGVCMAVASALCIGLDFIKRGTPAEGEGAEASRQDAFTAEDTSARMDRTDAEAESDGEATTRQTAQDEPRRRKACVRGEDA